MSSKGAGETGWGLEQGAELLFIPRPCWSGLEAAQLEVCPLPGPAASKMLLSPVRQGLRKLHLEPQIFPTHLSVWGTARPSEELSLGEPSHRSYSDCAPARGRGEDSCGVLLGGSA